MSRETIDPHTAIILNRTRDDTCIYLKPKKVNKLVFKHQHLCVSGVKGHGDTTNEPARRSIREVYFVSAVIVEKIDTLLGNCMSGEFPVL